MLPLVITVEQVDRGTRRYAFADSPVSIGRSPFAELQLSEPFISRWEGTLRFDADEITFFSLGSTNATYVNGKQLAQCEDDIPLSVHSVLTLGSLELRFSREPVAESDLRRKGKLRPTRDNAETGLKTMYLDAAALAKLRPARAGSNAASAKSQPCQAAGAPAPSCAPAVVSREASAQPSAEANPPSTAMIAPQSCIVLGGAPFAPPPVRRASLLSETALELDPARFVPAPAPQRLGMPSVPVAVHGGSAGDLEGGFAALHRTYREARTALLVDIRARLQGLAFAERAEHLAALIRSEPTLASDPDLQPELRRAGVLPPRDIPELRAWLHAISPDTFPEEARFDSERALARVLGLVEALTQSLAEIHDAQASVRRRWLGRKARRSILQSDNGNVVLAYLLDPHVDWNDRLRELEGSVRDAVTHELALFRATLEGARALVNTLSPKVIASSADSGDAASTSPAPGFWTRLLCKDAGDIGLWRRFLSMYGELTDGERYERIFLGRVFSRSYLAAMGQPDPARG
jgi:predicted component of type VI protein secretion system